MTLKTSYDLCKSTLDELLIELNLVSRIRFFVCHKLNNSQLLANKLETDFFEFEFQEGPSLHFSITEKRFKNNADAGDLFRKFMKLISDDNYTNYFSIVPVKIEFYLDIQRTADYKQFNDIVQYFALLPLQYQEVTARIKVWDYGRPKLILSGFSKIAHQLPANQGAYVYVDFAGTFLFFIRPRSEIDSRSQMLSALKTPYQETRCSYTQILTPRVRIKSMLVRRNLKPEFLPSSVKHLSLLDCRIDYKKSNTTPFPDLESIEVISSSVPFDFIESHKKTLVDLKLILSKKQDFSNFPRLTNLTLEHRLFEAVVCSPNLSSLLIQASDMHYSNSSLESIPPSLVSFKLTARDWNSDFDFSRIENLRNLTLISTIDKINLDFQDLKFPRTLRYLTLSRFNVMLSRGKLVDLPITVRIKSASYIRRSTRGLNIIKVSEGGEPDPGQIKTGCATLIIEE